MPSQEPFDAGRRVDGPPPPTGGAVDAAELYRRTVEYGFDRAREALRRHGLAAALLFDPRDQQSVTDGVRRVLGDERLRAELIAAGLERARGFTWRRTAELTLAAYRRALAARRGA